MRRENERSITVIHLLNLSLLFILLSFCVVVGEGGRGDVHDDEVKESTNTRSIKKRFVLEEFSAKHPLVREELLKRGWEELTNRREGDEGGRQARHRFFDLKWTWRWVPVSRSQWLNHFPTYPEIGYKVHLAKNLRRLSSNGEADAKSLKSWWPRAYILFSGGFNYHMTSEDTKSDEYLLRGLKDERNSFLQDFNRLRKLEETTINCEGQECVIESSSSSSSPASSSSLSSSSSSLSSSSSSPPFELQPSIDGEENIWIVKPGVLARGLGIKIFNDSQKVLSYIDSYQHVLGDSFVVQKYIETPFLVQERKFDIRQFVLVTSLNPLTIFMFHKCYLRFCHVEYSHSDLENKFAHLTNHQIQKDYEGNQGIEGTQWSLKQFKDHLTSSSFSSSSSSSPSPSFSSSEKKGIWETQIEPKIRELIVDSLRTWPIEGHRERSFELLGYDIMLDQDLNPYLLEININPGLHLLTDVVGDHHPQVVAGLFNVTVDRPEVWQSLGTVGLNEPEREDLTQLYGGWKLIYRGSTRTYL